MLFKNEIGESLSAIRPDHSKMPRSGLSADEIRILFDKNFDSTKINAKTYRIRYKKVDSIK